MIFVSKNWLISIDIDPKPKLKSLFKVFPSCTLSTWFYYDHSWETQFESLEIKGQETEWFVPIIFLSLIFYSEKQDARQISTSFPEIESCCFNFVRLGTFGLLFDVYYRDTESCYNLPFPFYQLNYTKINQVEKVLILSKFIPKDISEI